MITNTKTRKRTRMYCQKALLDKGWTLGMIKKLLPEPMLRANPVIKGGDRMKLWVADYVDEIMKSEEYEVLYNKDIARRKKISRSLLDFYLKKECEFYGTTIDSIEEDFEEYFEIPIIADEILVNDALEYQQLFYEEQLLFGKIDYLPDVFNAPEEEKNRWIVNYIRHELTCYDCIVRRYDDGSNKDRAFFYHQIKEKTLTEIKAKYPKYAEECDKQIKKIPVGYF